MIEQIWSFVLERFVPLGVFLSLVVLSIAFRYALDQFMLPLTRWSRTYFDSLVSRWGRNRPS